jgi:regulator of RNase E activity RraA
MWRTNVNTSTPVVNDAARVDRTPQLRIEFERLYSGVLFDAMAFDVGYARPFVLDAAVKPASEALGRRAIFGHAFTCRGRLVETEADINDTVRIAMFREFTQGCVQVIETGGDDTVAHFGDISGRIARRFGAVGAVIDGNTRDLSLLEQIDFPVWCRGVQPIDAFGRWQIVAYQVHIALRGIQGDVEIAPNDYVFADADGVLVIPNPIVDDVRVAAGERLTRENLIRRRVGTEEDIQALYDKIGRW